VYKITRREVLVNNVYVFDVEAPAIARKAKAGQFIILRVDDHGERIPVTIADFDRETGTITIVFMAVGTTTRKLARMNEGDYLPTFVGPLGNPTHIENFSHEGKVGKVVCIGGGVGTATIFPVARAFREAGNHVITIAGWRMKDLIFWEDRLRAVSDELIVCTDDGSVGRKAVVTVPLKEMLEAGDRPDLVIAIGPAIMMKFAGLTTKPFGVPTVVSLNPIMIDGTGMCGGCRVQVGPETKFACVDGPEFDAHLVDWDLLFQRQRSYLDLEKESLARWEHACLLDAQVAAKA
jgi:ferredoxin--NADP+ reductase